MVGLTEKLMNCTDSVFRFGCSGERFSFDFNRIIVPTEHVSLFSSVSGVGVFKFVQFGFECRSM